MLLFCQVFFSQILDNVLIYSIMMHLQRFFKNSVIIRDIRGLQKANFYNNLVIILTIKLMIIFAIKLVMFFIIKLAISFIIELMIS